MTICIATDGYPPQVGGIATFNEHLVTILTGAGHQVIVLYIDYDNKETDRITEEGLLTKVQLGKSYATHYKSWSSYFRPGGFNAPNWIATGMAMRDWLLANHSKYKIDIIEASDYGGCAIFLLDQDLPPVVITGHGSLLQYSRYNFTIKDDNYAVVRELESLSFQHSDVIISHSLLNKTDLETLFQRDIELATIPWTDKNVIQNPGVSNHDLVVVGGLQPIKGIYDMAEAMVLLNKAGDKTNLTWIGGDTWLAPGQQKMSTYLATKYPDVWQKTLRWENEQPFGYAQQAIAGARLVVIPAFFETFNYIALEAAAYKKPILITEKTGASFLFTHGKDAWKVTGNDPAGLAEAINYLLQQPQICDEMGKQAFDLLQSKFTPAIIGNERLAIYQKAIEKRKATPLNKITQLSFLDKYRTPVRKYYYFTRQLIKKLLGRG